LETVAVPREEGWMEIREVVSLMAMVFWANGGQR
jgi:hypothetical protein